MYIDFNTEEMTKSKHLYTTIKKDILNGHLRGDAKLMSTRSLANHLGISRNTVLEAYNQLIAEGYLYTKDRSGIYVKDGLVHDFNPRSELIDSQNLIGLQNEPQDDQLDFRTGIPNFDLFPKARWGKLYREVCVDLPSNQLDYYEPRGCYILREALAEHLRSVRGVTCEPDQILITGGAAQGFNLLVQHFSKLGTSAILEDPISYGITKIIQYYNMPTYNVPVDHQGINADSLHKEYDQLDNTLIFTTPSHQFPTGGVMPIDRRLSLIQYAQSHNSYIVEDDYDSEFRYEGLPIASMQSLAPDHIIYLGTFTKMLFPALRIGYMVLPKHLMTSMMDVKYIGDLHSPVLEQLTLARFISEGYLARHVNDSRKLYQKKCLFLVASLKAQFGDKVTIHGHSGGIHIMVEFHDIVLDDNILAKIKAQNIRIDPARMHRLSNPKYDHCLLFGFGNITSKAIEQGLKVIREILYPNL